MSKEVSIPPEKMVEIEAITARAQAGDQTAVPRLRELLAEFPHVASYYGDLANQAIAVWIALAAGGDLFLRESLSVKVAAMRVELAGENPTLVMEMAADRVVLGWMAAHYHAAMEGSALAARENPKLLAFRTKRRLQAERSHLNALGALVTLRKLMPIVSKPAATKGEVAALPQHADTHDISNRLSGYFADLSFSQPAAAREKAVATVQ